MVSGDYSNLNPNGLGRTPMAAIVMSWAPRLLSCRSRRDPAQARLVHPAQLLDGTGSPRERPLRSRHPTRDGCTGRHAVGRSGGADHAPPPICCTRGVAQGTLGRCRSSSVVLPEMAWWPMPEKAAYRIAEAPGTAVITARLLPALTRALDTALPRTRLYTTAEEEVAWLLEVCRRGGARDHGRTAVLGPSWSPPEMLVPGRALGAAPIGVRARFWREKTRYPVSPLRGVTCRHRAATVLDRRIWW